jgi:Tol biopolymer transport system component
LCAPLERVRRYQRLRPLSSRILYVLAAAATGIGCGEPTASYAHEDLPGKIAFALTRDVVLTTLATGERRPVVSVSGGAIDRFAWSADGRTIVIGMHKSLWPFQGDQYWLVRYNADGTGGDTIFDGAGQEMNPAFSADGRLAYRVHSGEVFQLYVDGSHVATSAFRNFPAWMPAGTGILLSRAEGLWLIDLETRTGTLVFEGDSLYAPHVSGAGRTAFTRWTAGAGEIWLLGAGWTNPQRLTSMANDDQPRWSPDGEYVAYVRDGREVRVMRIHDRLDRTVLQAGTAVRNLVWLP